ncbi:uncharacterized protein LOC120256750 [Dioscorea cayenensis subsp. rotundata]|uniref:Uncharacterized protein LOC120256750 n=1 Tax=Dioscorea cayennensis subsp. rotundata TaxID=55577 RepID=A0AB40AZ64_DIOCR|nr:uncharacterized protein LOC120256750 [Dioscorea cayenensis subsp. rotundata]
MSGLATNFAKTCLFSSKLGELPQRESATLNQITRVSSTTYLGVPDSPEDDLQCDWEELIQKVRRRLYSWKVNHLSLGDFRGGLLKSRIILKRVLVVGARILITLSVDQLGWEELMPPRDREGWGILDLRTFNLALLRKWWWKFVIDPSWCGTDVVQFNYGLLNPEGDKGKLEEAMGSVRRSLEFAGPRAEVEHCSATDLEFTLAEEAPGQQTE